MHNFLYHNDRILPLAQVRLSPGQAGLFNGWGLFTTMRIYDGQPFAFERHWNRLSRDAQRTQIPLNYSGKAVLAALQEVILANKVSQGCVRIYLIYNTVGFWRSDESFPATDLLIYTTELPERGGVTTLALREHGRHAAHPLTGAKVTSWLQNVWALEQAQQRGFDEVILLNERGEVTECTAANLFCVRKGVVETPPLSSGCLAGVTREILLEISQEAGSPVRERPLTLGELLEAEEVFITSTTREVQPVRQIEDHVIPHAPGPVTTRLARAFTEYVVRYFTRSATSSR